MERVNDFFCIDEADWPLVRIRYETTPTLEELDASHVRMDVLYERDGWRATLIEVERGVTLNAALRRRQADWMARQTDALQAKCVGVAFVLPSAVLRGMLTAVLWLQPLPVPHIVVSRIEEAEAWCQARLEEAGCTPAASAVG